MCLDVKSLSQRRAKSTECLQKERGKYSPVFALRDVVRAEQVELRRSMDLSAQTPFGGGELKKTLSAENPLFQLGLDPKPQHKPRYHTYHSPSKEAKDKILGKPPNGVSRPLLCRLSGGPKAIVACNWFVSSLVVYF